MCIEFLNCLCASKSLDKTFILNEKKNNIAYGYIYRQEDTIMNQKEKRMKTKKKTILRLEERKRNRKKIADVLRNNAFFNRGLSYSL